MKNALTKDVRAFSLPARSAAAAISRQRAEADQAVEVFLRHAGVAEKAFAIPVLK